MMGVVSAATLALSAAAFAQQDHPTAQEARAMLDKVVAAVKADNTKALDMFNKGEGGFRDRPLSILLQYQRREDRCRWQP
jgi:hypothetical protein